MITSLTMTGGTLPTNIIQLNLFMAGVMPSVKIQ
jgi:hypothetical protein